MNGKDSFRQLFRLQSTVLQIKGKRKNYLLFFYVSMYYEVKIS
jgi:hypothetical protein